MEGMPVEPLADPLADPFAESRAPRAVGGVPAPSPLGRSGASGAAPRARGALAVAAALALAAVAPGTAAAGPYASGRAYLEVQAGGGNVRVSDLQFYPVIGGVTVGVYVRPGIGVELSADGGIDADEDGGFELGLDGAAAASLRFESPPTRSTSGYVTLGYVAYTLSQEREAGGGAEIDEDFGGLRASIGVVQRLKRVPALSVSGEFRTWYTEDGLHLTALLLGLRLSAP